jgi:hypothetical protein
VGSGRCWSVRRHGLPRTLVGAPSSYSLADDNVDDKATRAECPRGSLLIGGGAAVQHGNATPSVAV